MHDLSPRRRTILVTGGAGFIGANLVRRVLARTDLAVINLDALTYAGHIENLAGIDAAHGERHRFVHGDVCDARAVLPLMEEADAVVHLAAESHVDRSIGDAAPFVRTNVLGTQTLLDCLRDAERRAPRAAPRRFVHVSTDEVYGSLPLDRPDLRFTERSPLAPNSPYAASKAASDLLVRAAHRTHGVDAVITRGSNSYGPHQFPEKVIPLFVTNLLQGRRVPLYGDGLNVRDWLHVDDHCDGILAALERGHAGEAYNLGADNERSNLELTHAILELMGAGPDMIEHVADRPGHDRRYALDSTKARHDLGWSPARADWRAALAETIDWYRNNRRWWERRLAASP